VNHQIVEFPDGSVVLVPEPFIRGYRQEQPKSEPRDAALAWLAREHQAALGRKGLRVQAQGSMVISSEWDGEQNR